MEGRTCDVQLKQDTQVVNSCDGISLLGLWERLIW